MQHYNICSTRFISFYYNLMQHFGLYIVFKNKKEPDIQDIKSHIFGSTALTYTTIISYIVLLFIF
nr:MAG TPA: hypothetical protein [Caudoviricetes sp.]